MTPLISLRYSGVFLLLALLLAGVFSPAQAAMSLNHTRLIVTAKEREATIDVRSEDEMPILLQTCRSYDSMIIDPRYEELAEDIPFILTPAVTRLDPGNGQSVRILRIGDGLPQERESLFWFNVHETPTRPANNGPAGENYIQLAFHVRIKLFYRPAALADYTLTDAHKLHFSLGHNDAGEPVLNIRNPAPIHQSIGTLALAHGDERIELDAPMLAPDSQLQLPVGKPLPASSGLRVVYSTIDDDGGLMDAEHAL